LEDFEMNSDSSLTCLNIEDISPGTVIMVWNIANEVFNDQALKIILWYLNPYQF
jgi:hypothetical protein